MFISNWLICPPVHCSIIIDQLFGEKSPLVVESVRLPGAGDGSLPPWFVNVELADPANCLLHLDPEILDSESWIHGTCQMPAGHLWSKDPFPVLFGCLANSISCQHLFSCRNQRLLGVLQFCIIFTFCGIFHHGLWVRGVLWGQEMSRPRQGYFCECHVTLLYTLS